ncbi:Phosphatase tensin type [Penicillium verhagenii]|uniref:Phosphatase tensin type n=1 Tax=Penicillium verhagenii TaxID=1562060 RepID=UPI0025457247|nr:Phosphatase tensin type [Penicillium verhagenii]KAJ5923932.1 Phosphatase tensin type [Penicillium verhagenii]
MSSILRQIVAGPRLQHPEANLDLCYVTDNIIATSGPSGTYPQRAYRNPLDALVTFLDSKHGSNWCIWEFRAEGTGYPDSEVYGRIHHFPWPDHHPPPFALVPNIMASMRNWLQRLDEQNELLDSTDNSNQSDSEKKQNSSSNGDRVVVVHCKAGKGRSGTIATAYLISQEGWKKEDALQRFTDRRMRVGFGAGVSIPSQLRYVDYIDRWTNQLNKVYIERPVEIVEIHVWGMRDGVKVAVEGYVDEGKKRKCIHMFHRRERTVIESGNTTPVKEQTDVKTANLTPGANAPTSAATWAPSPMASQSDFSSSATDLPRPSTISPATPTLSAAIFKPEKPLIVPGSDVNIDFERRSKASYTGFAMVTSVAHVWFNPYFEGGDKHDSGVFETEWEAMDGIKGSVKKGIRALERLKVVWRYPDENPGHTPSSGHPIKMPEPGEPINEGQASDWQHTSQPESESGSSPPHLGDEQENRPPLPDRAASKASSEVNSKLTTSSETPAPSTSSNHEESAEGLDMRLGLRPQTDASKDVSLAGSEDEERTVDEEGRVVKGKGNGDLEGVRSYFKDGQDDG